MAEEEEEDDDDDEDNTEMTATSNAPCSTSEAMETGNGEPSSASEVSQSGE